MADEGERGAVIIEFVRLGGLVRVSARSIPRAWSR
jgi:hypothetical protein